MVKKSRRKRKVIQPTSKDLKRREARWGQKVRRYIQKGYHITKDWHFYKTTYQRKPYYSEYVQNLRINPRLKPIINRYWTPRNPIRGALNLARDLLPLGQGGLRNVPEDSRFDYSKQLEIPQLRDSTITYPEPTYQEYSTPYQSTQQNYRYIRKYRAKTDWRYYPPPPITRVWAGRFARDLPPGVEPDERRRRDTDEDQDDRQRPFNRPCFH